MRAVVRGHGRVGVRRVPAPRVAAPHHVVVAIRAAGVCRTDARVAAGEIPCADPIVLGHELAGEVLAVGRGVVGIRVGDPVSADPRVGCGCGACAEAPGCPRPALLGVSAHGAFAERVALPAAAVVPLPAGVPWRHAAMVEPVAAALAAAHPALPRDGRGLVLGTGRVATLAARVLRRVGFRDVACGEDGAGFDFVVETHLGGLQEAAARVRPGGAIVVKSRTGALEVPVERLQRLRVTLHFVRYGDFGQAAALVADAGLLDGLLGPDRPLDAFADAFASVEGPKPFLVP